MFSQQPEAKVPSTALDLSAEAVGAESRCCDRQREEGYIGTRHRIRREAGRALAVGRSIRSFRFHYYAAPDAGREDNIYVCTNRRLARLGRHRGRINRKPESISVR